jgi:hypothetical protein
MLRNLLIKLPVLEAVREGLALVPHDVIVEGKVETIVV